MTEVNSSSFLSYIDRDTYAAGFKRIYMPDELLPGEEHIVRIKHFLPTTQRHAIDFTVVVEENEHLEEGLSLQRAFPQLTDIIMSAAPDRSNRTTQKINVDGVLYAPNRFIFMRAFAAFGTPIGYFPKPELIFAPPEAPQLPPLL